MYIHNHREQSIPIAPFFLIKGKIMLACHDSNVVLNSLSIGTDADEVVSKDGIITMYDNQGALLTLISAKQWQDIGVVINKVTRTAGDYAGDMTIGQCMLFKNALCGLFKLSPDDMEAPEPIANVVRQLAALFECEVDSVTMFGYVFARLNDVTQFSIDFEENTIEFETVGNVTDGIRVGYDEIRIANSPEYVESFDALIEQLNEFIKEL